MNNNLTEIIAILDMSGSMHELTSDTIGGYNSLIEEQKKQPGQANITTVLFDDRYFLLHDRENIQNVKPLTTKEYTPCGMTAMLDAIGKTLISVGKKLADTPEEERPGSVLVTIITDGYENASKEYSYDMIKKMIEEQRNKYNWIFTFIGADIDTMTVGQSIGIDASMSKTYTKSTAGTDSVYHTLSKSITFARRSGGVGGQSVRMSYDAMINEMSNILDEIE